MNWWDYIIHWDQMAFLQIHVGWQNDFFDTVMPVLRNKYTWVPLYALLLFFAVKHYGKIALYWVLVYILLFALTDFTAASLLKPLICRIRPCNHELIQPFIRQLVVCGSGFSFPSAHASNHVGMSVFIIFTLARYYKWMVLPSALWALLVVIAQVYVGVHYPLDILGGMVIGTTYGLLMSMGFNKFFPDRITKIRLQEH